MKKGAIEINRLIAMALAVMALIVLALIFSQGARDFASNLFQISDEATIGGDKCTKPLAFRQCYDQTCSAVTSAARNSSPNALYSLVPPPSGGWSDCTGSGKFCCEQTR